MTEQTRSTGGLVLLVLVLALTLWQALAYRSHVVDDAWITARYARNLQRGEGLCFNVGQKVEGFSNFLLVAAEALGMQFGLEPITVAQLLGVFSLLLLQLLLYLEGIRCGFGEAFALVVPLLLGAASPMSYWAVAGLETMPYALLLTAAVLAAARERRGEGASALFFGLLGLLTLCRTEGAAAALLLGGYWAWQGSDAPSGPSVQERLRACLRRLLPLLVFIGVYHAFRHLYFGSLSSAPAIAKWNGSIRPLTEGGKYLLSLAVEFLPSYLVFLWLWSVFRPGETSGGSWLLLALQSAIVLTLGGDWMPLYRKFVPVLPLCLFEACRGAQQIYLRMHGSRRRSSGRTRHEGRNARRENREPRRMAGDRVFLVAGSLSCLLVALQLSFVPVAQSFKLAMGRRIQGLFAEMSEVLVERFPPGTRVVLGDIGYVGYRSDFEILDLKGLVSPWIARSYRIVPEGGHLRIALDGAAVLARKPEVVLLAVHRREGSPRDEGFWACDTELLNTPALAEGWRPLRRFVPPDGGHPQYLMYVRKDLPGR